MTTANVIFENSGVQSGSSDVLQLWAKGSYISAVAIAAAGATTVGNNNVAQGITAPGVWSFPITVGGGANQVPQGEYLAQLQTSGGIIQSVGWANINNTTGPFYVKGTEAETRFGFDGSNNLYTVPQAMGAGATVQLAASQPNYAPAKAGQQMDLVSAPNATAVTAIQSGLALHTDATTIESAITSLGSPMQAGAQVQLAASQPNYAPAKAGQQMDLVSAPNATAIAAIQSGLALAATALSNAIWTNARASNLDNLNVGGAVASHADITSLNTNASRHAAIKVVSVLVRPQSGSNTFTVRLECCDAVTGALRNADTTPTLTATGSVSGSLAANLGAVTNSSTGVYDWIYTVQSTATEEQVIFSSTPTIAGSAFPTTAFSQVLEDIAAVFNATFAGYLTSIYNKLPPNNIADQSLLTTSIGSPMQAGTAVQLSATQPNYAPAKAGQQMDLVSAPNATAVTAIQSGLALHTDATTIEASISALGSPMQAGTAVQLAATQPNYAPAKAGQQMDLVSAPNATAVTAIQSGLATHADATTIEAAIAALPTETDVATIEGLINTLISRLTAARASYLDNLNVGGPVSSHADVTSLNTSASRHASLKVVSVLVRPQAASNTFTVRLECYDAVTGGLRNADSTPTLTATGNVSGNLSANLGAVTNSSTGTYDWIYTVQSTATEEQVLFSSTPTIAGSAFPTTAFSQVLEDIAAVFNATFAGYLTSIYNKLPQNNIADQSLLTTAIGSPMQAGSAVQLATNQPNYAPAKAGQQMDLVGAPNATAITAIQSGLATHADATTIEAAIAALPTETDVANIESAISSAATAIEAAVAAIDVGGSIIVGGFTPGAIAQLGPKINIIDPLGVGPTKCIKFAAGDEISAAMGNQIPVTLIGTFPSLTGWTCQLLVERNGTTVSGTATIVSATTSQVVLGLNLPAGETSKLQPGEGIAQVRLMNGPLKWSIIRRIKAEVSPNLVANA